MFTFLVHADADEKWRAGRPPWEQTLWAEHAAFINQLQAVGTLYMAGPVADFSGIRLVLQGPSLDAVQSQLNEDPWLINGVLKLRSIEQWIVLVDPRTGYEKHLSG